MINFLANYKDNTYVPNAWGFTIYRAVFGPGSDERFAAGLKQLEDWIRFRVRQDRYDGDMQTTSPSEPDTEPNNILAERMWNEVVEDYPDKEMVKSHTTPDEEGQEDFSAIGGAFIRWVDGLGVDEDASRSNARYNHCLILDDAALRSLERLPTGVPEVKHRERRSAENRELSSLLYHTWVWLLDRNAMEEREAGTRVSGRDYPPWIRVRLCEIQTVWFRRTQFELGREWDGVVFEDPEKWDSVFWWAMMAKSWNEAARQARGETVEVDPREAAAAAAASQTQ